jgi:hypothetical protein
VDGCDLPGIACPEYNAEACDTADADVAQRLVGWLVHHLNVDASANVAVPKMPYTVILRSVLGLVSETPWLPEAEASFDCGLMEPRVGPS